MPVSFLLPDIAPDRIVKELNKLAAKNENYKLTIADKNERDQLPRNGLPERTL